MKKVMRVTPTFQSISFPTNVPILQSRLSKLHTLFLASFFLSGYGADIPISLSSKGLLIFPMAYPSCPIKRGRIQKWIN